MGDVVVAAGRGSKRRRFRSRREWLAARRFHIGGSDAARICGLVDGGTLALYLDKLALLPERPSVEAMDMGIALEPHVLKRYAEKWCTPDERLRHEQHVLLVHPTLPWAACSPDASVLNRASGDLVRGVDAKAWARKERKRFGPAWSDRIPMPAWAQGQWSCAVTGAPCWDFPFYFIGIGTVPYRVWRHDKVAARMLERGAEWWERHIVGRVAPNDGPRAGLASEAAARRAWPVSTNARETATVDDLEVVERLVVAENVYRQAIRTRAALRAELMVRMGESERLGVVVGKKHLDLATFRSPADRQVVDWRAFSHLVATALEELAPTEAGDIIAAAMARTTSTVPGSRRFLNKAGTDTDRLLAIARKARVGLPPEHLARVDALIGRLAPPHMIESPPARAALAAPATNPEERS